MIAAHGLVDRVLDEEGGVTGEQRFADVHRGAERPHAQLQHRR